MLRQQVCLKDTWTLKSFLNCTTALFYLNEIISLKPDKYVKHIWPLDMSCINQIYFLLQNHVISSAVKQMCTRGALWVIHSPSGKLIIIECIVCSLNIESMFWTWHGHVLLDMNFMFWTEAGIWGYFISFFTQRYDSHSHIIWSDWICVIISVLQPGTHHV